MKRTTAASCLAALAFGAPTILPAHADEKPIVIGFATAQTGWVAPYDNGVKAAEIAIEEINAKGGLLGRPIVTVYSDTKSDRAQGAKAGLDVIQKGADLVVVTCDYDMGAPAALEAARAGKVAWSLCAEDAKMGVQGVGPLTFTASGAAQLQGASLAEWAYKNKGIRNPYVLLDTSVEYNKSVCFGFDVAWKALSGAEPKARDTFKNADPSIASQITRMKGSTPAPDAIVLCSYAPGGATATKQIRAAGLDVPILAATAMDGNFWLGAVPNLSNFYYPVLGSVYGDDPDPAINEFLKKYEAKYNSSPAESHTLAGYELIQLYAAAVEKAKSTDPKAVTAAAETFKDLPTLLGPFSFTPDLHIQTKFRYTIMSVDGGKHKSVEKWTSETPMTKAELFRKAE
ncbi:amino acid/amide ABC transporter substrate-binding protein (HAAT family) [Roseiarcus fermentans]|uniref:Amino acid/amide ABC transporter substrate-binding protein (HAAT family) n=1 Tax=Roseiarcus fermentans TaxID=1473586 RepID=A0A366FIS0_9HYPH|nr:ABC transporter substrate-binding protein [Roseiarcus fermentans]RBP14006.1 amino acid/amide ABC transporter substrate-binding protein (HAAT family) [Roseiarcus fermentans]